MLSSSRSLIRSAFSALFCVLLLSACGGGDDGGDGGDTTAPQLSIASPANDTDTTEPSIVVSGTASDEDSTVSSVTVNGATATSSDNFANWTADIDLNAGANTITVLATDSAGNTQTRSVLVTFTDNEDPEVSISSPADNSITLDATITVSGTASDNSGVLDSVTVNGVDADSSDNFANWSADIDLADGDNTVTAVVTDSSGNSTTETITVNRTNEDAPTISITSPDLPATTSQQMFVIRGVATDIDGVTDVTVNGVTASTNNNFVNWQLEQTLNTGINSISIGATDGLGNSDTSIVEFDISYSPNLPTATITSPENNLTVNQSQITISGTTESQTNIVRVSVDGIDANSQNNFQNWSAEVPLAEGENTFVVSLEDENETINSNAANLTVTRSDEVAANQAPVISGSSNVTFEENGTGVAFVLNATDPDADPIQYSVVSGSDRTSFELEVNNGEMSFVTIPNFEYPNDSDDDNIYEITLAATDDKGLTTTADVTVEVTDIDDIEVIVTYPTQNANLGGEKDMTTVSGRLENVAVVDIDEVTVNGVTATFSIDDPLRWTAQIPVQENADNDIEVVATSLPGPSGIASLQVSNDMVYESISNVAYDELNERLLLVDNSTDRIFSFDLISKSLSTFASSTVGSGVDIAELDSLAMDSGNNRLLVVSSDETFGPSDLLAIDLDSGVRSLLGVMPEGSIGASIKLDAATNSVYYALFFDDQVRRMDLSTGMDEIVADNSIGTGPDIQLIRGIGFDATANRIYASNVAGREIIAIDPSTGNRENIANSELGSGPNVSGTQDIYVDDNHVFLVGSSILSLDVSTGDRFSVAGSSVGIGEAIGLPINIAVDAISNRAWVSRTSNLDVLEVDLSLGDRFPLLRQSGAGSGALLTVVSDLAVDNTRNKLFVAGKNKAYQIDLATFERSDIPVDSVFFQESGSSRSRMAYDQITGDIYHTRLGFNSILYRFDTASNTSIVVSDYKETPPSVGNGTPFFAAFDLALDKTNQRVIIGVSDETYGPEYTKGLLGVDLVSGDRNIISNNDTGTGDDYSNFPDAVAINDNGSNIFVLQSSTVLTVNPANGDRTILSSSLIGTGETIPNQEPNMEFNATTGKLYVADYDKIISIDTGTGDRELIHTYRETNPKGYAPQFPETFSVDGPNNRIFSVSPDQSIMVIDIESGERAIAAF